MFLLSIYRTNNDEFLNETQLKKLIFLIRARRNYHAEPWTVRARLEPAVFGIQACARGPRWPHLAHPQRAGQASGAARSLRHELLEVVCLRAAGHADG